MKMKTTFAYILSSCFLAVVLAQKCIEQAECEEGTCCAGVPPWGGVCAPLTPEGGKCHVVDKTVPIFGDFYIGSCPCDVGLECIQEGKKKNNGICQVPPTTPAPATDAVVDEAGHSGASDDASSAEAAPAEAEAAPAEPEAAAAEE